MQLTDLACLVTGGTKGIGAATAIALAEAGANLALAARHEDAESRSTATQIDALGRRCQFIAADLAKPQDARRCVERTLETLGSLDVLVHAAGGPVPGGLMDLTDDAWLKAFDLHVHAVFHLCRAAVPAMRRSKRGVIVLISSAAGIRGIKGNLAYQTVKGVLPQLTRGLAYELADDNIRVNCVAPGVIRTAFHATMSDQTRKNNVENRIPLHREGAPQQVAAMIRELIVNDYITGQTVVIDGGLTMRIC